LGGLEDKLESAFGTTAMSGENEVKGGIRSDPSRGKEKDIRFWCRVRLRLGRVLIKKDFAGRVKGEREREAERELLA
jgi:hypothetical protein